MCQYYLIILTYNFKFCFVYYISKESIFYLQPQIHIILIKSANTPIILLIL